MTDREGTLYHTSEVQYQPLAPHHLHYHLEFTSSRLVFAEEVWSRLLGLSVSKLTHRVGAWTSRRPCTCVFAFELFRFETSGRLNALSLPGLGLALLIPCTFCRWGLELLPIVIASVVTT